MVDRVGVGREEVARAAHLVVVDEQLARVAPQQLDLGVGLGLGAREPVAVEVEAVRVLAAVGDAAVRVLGGQDHHDRRVEHVRRGAVAPVGELVERAQGGVQAALLAAVHVAGDPQGRGRAVDDPAHLARGRVGVLQPRGGLADGGEAVGGDVAATADDRVAQWAALDRAPERGRDHAVRGVVDRREVGVGGLDRDLVLQAGAGRRLRDLAAELRRRLERVAGRRLRGRGSRDGRAGGQREQERGERATHGSNLPNGSRNDGRPPGPLARDHTRRRFSRCRRCGRRRRRGRGGCSRWSSSSRSSVAVVMGTSGCAACSAWIPSGAATRQMKLMSRAPARLSRPTAWTALPPVASIGSTTNTDASATPGGMFS